MSASTFLLLIIGIVVASGLIRDFKKDKIANIFSALSLTTVIGLGILGYFG
jgi:hypothetical protein